VRSLTTVLASLWLGGLGAPCLAATQSAPITATVNKPLVLSSIQNMDFGTITLGPGTWANATVSISQAGTLICSSANLLCTGATLPAKYNVQGSNRQTVQISAPNVTLVNQADASKTLTLVTDAPATVLLTSSGIPGVDFSIGGSVTLSSATAPGTYAGTFNVTVNY
jgi:spore coat protein U-like protein